MKLLRCGNKGSERPAALDKNDKMLLQSHNTQILQGNLENVCTV